MSGFDIGSDLPGFLKSNRKQQQQQQSPRRSSSSSDSKIRSSSGSAGTSLFGNNGSGNNGNNNNINNNRKQRNLARPIKSSSSSSSSLSRDYGVKNNNNKNKKIFDGISISETMKREEDVMLASEKLAELEADDDNISLSSVNNMKTIPSINDSPDIMSLVTRIRDGGNGGGGSKTSSTTTEPTTATVQSPRRRQSSKNKTRTSSSQQQQYYQKSPPGTPSSSSSSSSSSSRTNNKHPKSYAIDGSPSKQQVGVVGSPRMVRSSFTGNNEKQRKSNSQEKQQSITSATSTRTNNDNSDDEWGRDSYGLFRGGNINELIQSNNNTTTTNDDEDGSILDIDSASQRSSRSRQQQRSSLSQQEQQRQRKSDNNNDQLQKPTQQQPSRKKSNGGGGGGGGDGLNWIPIVPTSSSITSPTVATRNSSRSDDYISEDDDDDSNASTTEEIPLSKEAQRLQEITRKQKEALAAALSQTIHSVESVDLQSMVSMDDDDDNDNDTQNQQTNENIISYNNDLRRRINDDDDDSENDDDDDDDNNNLHYPHRPLLLSKATRKIQVETQNQKRQVRTAITDTPDSSDAIIMKSEALMSNDELESIRRKEEGWHALDDDNDDGHKRYYPDNNTDDDDGSDRCGRRPQISGKARKIKADTNKLKGQVRATMRETNDASESLHEIKSDDATTSIQNNKDWNKITGDDNQQQVVDLHSTNVVDGDRTYDNTGIDDGDNTTSKTPPNKALAKHLQATTTSTTTSDVAAEGISMYESMDSMAFSFSTSMDGGSSIISEVQRNKHIIQTATARTANMEDPNQEKEQILVLKQKASSTTQEDPLGIVSEHPGDYSSKQRIDNVPSGEGIDINRFKEARDRKPDKVKPIKRDEVVVSTGGITKLSNRSSKQPRKEFEMKNNDDWHRVPVSNPSSQSHGKYKSKDDGNPNGDNRPSKSKLDYNLPESNLAVGVDLPLASGEWKGIQLNRQDNNNLYRQDSGDLENDDDDDVDICNDGERSEPNVSQNNKAQSSNQIVDESSESGEQLSSSDRPQCTEKETTLAGMLEQGEAVGKKRNEKRHSSNDKKRRQITMEEDVRADESEEKDVDKLSSPREQKRPQNTAQVENPVIVPDDADNSALDVTKRVPGKSSPSAKESITELDKDYNQGESISVEQTLDPFSERPPDQGPFAYRPVLNPFAVRPPEAGPFAARPTIAGRYEEARSVGSFDGSDLDDAPPSPGTQSVDRHIVRESSHRRLLRKKVEDQRSSLKKMVHQTATASLSTDNELLDLKRKLALSQMLVQQLETENSEIQRQSVLYVAKAQLALLEQRNNREKELEQSIKELMAERNAAVDECHHLRILITESCPMCRKRLEDKEYVMDKYVRNTILSRRKRLRTSEFQWFNGEELSEMADPSDEQIQQLKQSSTRRLLGLGGDATLLDLSIPDSGSVAGNMPTFTHAPMQWMSDKLMDRFFKQDAGAQDDIPPIEDVPTFSKVPKMHWLSDRLADRLSGSNDDTPANDNVPTFPRAPKMQWLPEKLTERPNGEEEDMASIDDVPTFEQPPQMQWLSENLTERLFMQNNPYLKSAIDVEPVKIIAYKRNPTRKRPKKAGSKTKARNAMNTAPAKSGRPNAAGNVGNVVDTKVDEDLASNENDGGSAQGTTTPTDKAKNEEIGTSENVKSSDQNVSNDEVKESEEECDGPDDTQNHEEAAEQASSIENLQLFDPWSSPSDVIENEAPVENQQILHAKAEREDDQNEDAAADESHSARKQLPKEAPKKKGFFSSLFGERVEDEFEGIDLPPVEQSKGVESRSSQAAGSFRSLFGLEGERVEDDAVFAGVEDKLAMIEEHNLEIIPDSRSTTGAPRSSQMTPEPKSNGGFKFGLKDEKVMDDMEILNSLFTSSQVEIIKETNIPIVDATVRSEAPRVEEKKKKRLFGLKAEKVDRDTHDMLILGHTVKSGDTKVQNITASGTSNASASQLYKETTATKQKRGMFGLKNEKFDGATRDDEILNLLKNEQPLVSQGGRSLFASKRSPDGAKKKHPGRFGLKGEKVQDDMSFLASPLSSPNKRSLSTNKGRIRSSPQVDYKNMFSSTASRMQQIPALNDDSIQPNDGNNREESDIAESTVDEENTNRREEFSNSRQESMANFAPIEVEEDDRPWRISGKKPSISKHIESSKAWAIQEETGFDGNDSTGDISDLNHLASLVEMEKKWG